MIRLSANQTRRGFGGRGKKSSKSLNGSSRKLIFVFLALRFALNCWGVPSPHEITESCETMSTSVGGVQEGSLSKNLPVLGASLGIRWIRASVVIVPFGR